MGPRRFSEDWGDIQPRASVHAYIGRPPSLFAHGQKKFGKSRRNIALSLPALHNNDTSVPKRVLETSNYGLHAMQVDPARETPVFLS